MKNLLLVMLITAIFAGCQQTQQSGFDYPNTKKIDTVDNYFGTKVKDPYRWLENDTSAETEAWVKKQNEVTFDYLESIPFRDDIRKRLKEIWNYEKYSTPYKRGNRYFFRKNDGLQDQSVLYTTQSLDEEPRVLLDPNKLSEDGTVALAGTTVSHDNQYLAYSISRSGSDWREIYVKNIETGEKLSDHLEWVKFSGISWRNDGFYYSRFDEPKEGQELSNVNKFQKVYYHKIGTSQSEDKLVYEDPSHPKRNFSAGTTEDERFLILYATESTSGNALYVKDLEKNGDFVQVAEGFEHDYNLVGNLDETLFIRTNDDASNYRLVAVNMQNPDKANWKTILPGKENVLRSVTLAGGKLVAHYMKDAHSKVEIYDYKGNYETDIELPTLGTMSSFSGRKDEQSAFYSFTSFTVPNIIYKYNFADGSSEVFRKPEMDINFDAYTTRQKFYKSKDGTEVPIFIVHKKGLDLDGTNPALLYGYGGFNISLTPGFSISRMIMLENNGVFAMPNIRGGGEYGEEWHQAGTKLKKQNVFDDFIAAAEYLIDEGYTNSDKLAIQGGSNGGLLVGAVTNQRPELFEVAIPAVGVMDMLRYHKFTIGWAWASDYGTSKDSVHFENLYNYSPLHNISAEKNYPAVMAMTADHDDRVVPAHSFKYIATLQEKYDGPNPVMIRIETKAGHGAGKPTSKRIQEAADIYSFIFKNMGVTPDYAK